MVYQQIYQIDRFDFFTLYTMPVPKRNFYYRYALKQNEDEKRAMDKARGATEGTPVSKKESSKVPGFVASQVSSKG